MYCIVFGYEIMKELIGGFKSYLHVVYGQFLACCFGKWNGDVHVNISYHTAPIDIVLMYRTVVEAKQKKTEKLMKIRKTLNLNEGSWDL